MLTIKDYVLPKTLEEAYTILNLNKNNAILGGCAFLRLGSKQIETAIDLSDLALKYINEKDNQIEIGAMTTLREIETSPVLQKKFSGILPESVKNVGGVQLRNIVTVGGTVYSRYGFSDLNTALLSLDTDVVLHRKGRISLEEFLEKGAQKDILEKIIIRKTKCQASFKMMRNSAADYAILNVAVSKNDNDWKIAVGARPQRAKIAKEAGKYLAGSKKTNEEIEEAAVIATKELAFGSNTRGSKEYRESICKVLVKRAIMEVI